MLTFLPLEQIDEMDHWEGSQLNQAKEILAYELTSLVHGEDEAKKAESGSKALFAGAGDEANMPKCELCDGDCSRESGIDLIGLKLAKAELVTTRSEGRRAIQQGGVTIDGEKITDVKYMVTRDQVENGFILRRGKKKCKKICLK